MAVVSILDDKDAAGMLRALLPQCRAAVVHELRQPARAAAGDAGSRWPASSATDPPMRAGSADPARALERARGAGRAAAASCWRPARSTSSPTSRAPGRPRRALDAVNDDDDQRFLPMIGLVAVVVALVILVFFAIGYAFGRLFL